MRWLFIQPNFIFIFPIPCPARLPLAVHCQGDDDTCESLDESTFLEWWCQNCWLGPERERATVTSETGPQLV